MKSGCLRQSRIVRSSIVLSRTSCRLDFPRLRNRNQSHIPARRERLEIRAVFYVHPAGSLHSSNADSVL